MSLFSLKLLTVLNALLVFVSLTAPPATAEISLSSGKNKVSVIELYTSEGCSSCPPADRWLSEFKDDAQLFERVIPLAFHVDYWNYLGWRDEFSAAAYSERQRNYNKVGRTSSVYTPGFVINGKEWRGFFNPVQRRSPPLTPAPAEVPGELTLMGSGDDYEITFRPSDLKQNLVVHLAYLGTGISNGIRRGENAGKQLRHDFVVLDLSRTRLKKSGGQYSARLRAPRAANGTAVAAWVSKPDDPAPIQAVGGWLAVH